MSVLRVIFVLFPLITTIVGVILGSLAIGGATSNIDVVKETYYARFDIYPESALTTSSSGLSYSFGLWGYCKGDYNDGDIKYTECSDPKTWYDFEPLEAITDDLGYGYSIDVSGKTKSYLNAAEKAVRVTYVTGILGICCLFLACVFTLISFKSRVSSFLAMLVGIVSAISMVIAAATITACIVLMRNSFNKTFDDYGLNVTLGNGYFYGFFWTACVCCILSIFFNFFGICCGSTHKGIL